MRTIVVTLMALAGVCSAQDKGPWVLEKPHAWARDAGSATVAQEGDAHRLHHTGTKDFSLGGFQRIAASHGDVFEVSCEVKVEKDASDARAELSAVLRDAEGQPLAWTWGAVTCPATGEWVPVKAHFAITKNGASVEPRVTGWAAQTVSVRKWRAVRTENFFASKSGAVVESWVDETSSLKVAFDDQTAAVTVTDKRTGRVWSPLPQGAQWLVVSAKAMSRSIRIINPQDMREFTVSFLLDRPRPELMLILAGKGAMRPLSFPAPFATKAGDRLIVPVNEGIGYPVDEDHTGLWRMHTYGGHGLCMPFFGVAAADGSGWMCILDTPDDGAMDARKGADGLWQAGLSWEPCKGEFGYPRRARFIFIDKGGHVAMCKRYREYAKQTGLLKTFTEKRKANPNIDLLIGAANIWSWDGKTAMATEMQDAGMTRLLWSAADTTTADDIAALNARPGILTGRYDIYQDIMDPANYDKIRYIHGAWVTDAFPHDINWAAPGVPRDGWEIELKEGDGMIPCAVICDAKALPYARKRIAEDLKTKPYRARFIDTTVAAPWFECYHPDHPMTRTDSKHWKMQLLRLISEEFGLVCGSETGHDASVPYCDYFEGMLSIGQYRVPDAGRNMQVIWDDVPADVLKYQVGEKYRLPLWELVYHDCVIAQWYWGDYNNKLPALWRKRDLFNALYGTPPMYMVTRKLWAEQKDRFIASYKTATPVARATGYSEMTDHRILTPDRAVQQTAFANGTTVTVNFGATPYPLPDGTVLQAMDARVTTP